MAIMSLICLVVGVFSLIEKRLFFFIVLLISGAALAIKMPTTNWNKEFFGISEIKVVGNAYTVFKFYGDMA